MCTFTFINCWIIARVRILNTNSILKCTQSSQSNFLWAQNWIYKYERNLCANIKKCKIMAIVLTLSTITNQMKDVFWTEFIVVAGHMCQCINQSVALYILLVDYCDKASGANEFKIIKLLNSISIQFRYIIGWYWLNQNYKIYKYMAILFRA